MDTNKVILYVDDEKPLLRIFKASYGRQFEILLAESGEEALELLKSNEVQVILTDQIMGGMKGTEFLEKFHSINSDAPPFRIIISGFSEDEDIQRSFEKHGLFKFVSKPWEREELNDLLTDLVNRES